MVSWLVKRCFVVSLVIVVNATPDSNYLRNTLLFVLCVSLRTVFDIVGSNALISVALAPSLSFQQARQSVEPPSDARNQLYDTQFEVM